MRGFSLAPTHLGTYLWRTPGGHWYQVDHHGTTHLGRQTPSTVHRHRVRADSPLEIELTDLLAV